MLPTRRQFIAGGVGLLGAVLGGCVRVSGDVPADADAPPTSTTSASTAAPESTPTAETRPSGVSDVRFARLTRGINTSHWFAQAQSYTKTHFKWFMKAEDIKLIRSIGFEHVRVSVNPAILLNQNEPAKLNRDNLDILDAALEMILAEGLAAIVDIHPEDEFKLKLADDDVAVAEFATFWQALARHLAQRDPEHIFLEVLNEPVMTDGGRWAVIQTQVLAAMREGAPAHTLIAAAHKWSSITELLTLKPVADPNVVYNFHCYDPHIFTHQGATWGWEMSPFFDHLPYPSSPETVAPVLDRIMNPLAKQYARDYGAERWNAERMDVQIAPVAQWAHQHNVRLTCNEFGVYRAKCAPEARNAWIRDARTAFEKYGIGWAMWDYAGGFGVVTPKGSTRTADPDTVRALGLDA